MALSAALFAVVRGYLLLCPLGGGSGEGGEGGSGGPAALDTVKFIPCAPAFSLARLAPTCPELAEAAARLLLASAPPTVTSLIASWLTPPKTLAAEAAAAAAHASAAAALVDAAGGQRVLSDGAAAAEDGTFTLPAPRELPGLISSILHTPTPLAVLLQAASACNSAGQAAGESAGYWTFRALLRVLNAARVSGSAAAAAAAAILPGTSTSSGGGMEIEGSGDGGEGAEGGRASLACLFNPSTYLSPLSGSRLQHFGTEACIWLEHCSPAFAAPSPPPPAVLLQHLYGHAQLPPSLLLSLFTASVRESIPTPYSALPPRHAPSAPLAPFTLTAWCALGLSIASTAMEAGGEEADEAVGARLLAAGQGLSNALNLGFWTAKLGALTGGGGSGRASTSGATPSESRGSATSSARSLAASAAAAAALRLLLFPQAIHLLRDVSWRLLATMADASAAAQVEAAIDYVCKACGEALRVLAAAPGVAAAAAAAAGGRERGKAAASQAAAAAPSQAARLATLLLAALPAAPFSATPAQHAAALASSAATPAAAVEVGRELYTAPTGAAASSTALALALTASASSSSSEFTPPSPLLASVGGLLAAARRGAAAGALHTCGFVHTLPSVAAALALPGAPSAEACLRAALALLPAPSPAASAVQAVLSSPGAAAPAAAGGKRQREKQAAASTAASSSKGSATASSGQEDAAGALLRDALTPFIAALTPTQLCLLAGPGVCLPGAGRLRRILLTCIFSRWGFSIPPAATSTFASHSLYLVPPSCSTCSLAALTAELTALAAAMGRLVVAVCQDAGKDTSRGAGWGGEEHRPQPFQALRVLGALLEGLQVPQGHMSSAAGAAGIAVGSGAASGSPRNARGMSADSRAGVCVQVLRALLAQPGFLECVRSFKGEAGRALRSAAASCVCAALGGGGGAGGALRSAAQARVAAAAEPLLTLLLPSAAAAAVAVAAASSSSSSTASPSPSLDHAVLALLAPILTRAQMERALASALRAYTACSTSPTSSAALLAALSAFLPFFPALVRRVPARVLTAVLLSRPALQAPVVWEECLGGLAQALVMSSSSGAAGGMAEAAWAGGLKDWSPLFSTTDTPGAEQSVLCSYALAASGAPLPAPLLKLTLEALRVTTSPAASPPAALPEQQLATTPSAPSPAALLYLPLYASALRAGSLPRSLLGLGILAGPDAATAQRINCPSLQLLMHASATPGTTATAACIRAAALHLLRHALQPSASTPAFLLQVQPSELVDALRLMGKLLGAAVDGAEAGAPPPAIPIITLHAHLPAAEVLAHVCVRVLGEEEGEGEGGGSCTALQPPAHVPCCAFPCMPWAAQAQLRSVALGYKGRVSC